MGKFLELTFTSSTKLARTALARGLQIRANLESAVAETVLLGVTKIAMDTPIDTGRLRASIAGEFGDQVDLTGPKVRASEITAGRKATGTFLNPGGLEGAVGTNVDYAAHVEFGHVVSVKAVTGRTYAKRKGGKIQRIAGRAMFRKNIPEIKAYFRQRCQLAVRNGIRGQGIGGEE
jgi:phage gpG-like protein